MQCLSPRRRPPQGGAGSILGLDKVQPRAFSTSARATIGYALLEDVAGEDSDYRTSELGLAGEYHFRRDIRFVPYLGVGIGWRNTHFGKLTESGLVYGPRAGLKFFLEDNVALDFEVTFKMASADVFINDFVAEDTDLSSGIGLRVLF